MGPCGSAWLAGVAAGLNWVNITMIIFNFTEMLSWCCLSGAGAARQGDRPPRRLQPDCVILQPAAHPPA